MGKEALTDCVENNRVLECEAAYYFPTGVDICGVPQEASSKKRPSLALSQQQQDEEEEEESSDDAVALNAGSMSSRSGSSLTGGGHLVVHVRSGDVFRIKKAYDSYGQVRLGEEGGGVL